jgi:hypothetical protein
MDRARIPGVSARRSEVISVGRADRDGRCADGCGGPGSVTVARVFVAGVPCPGALVRGMTQGGRVSCPAPACGITGQAIPGELVSGRRPGRGRRGPGGSPITGVPGMPGLCRVGCDGGAGRGLRLAAVGRRGGGRRPGGRTVS